MTTGMRRSMAPWILAACAAMAVHAASTEPYPSRPVKLIVAFTAGGTTDIMARMLAPGLTERFKQPIIIAR